MKKFIEEFKEFAVKGNVFDLAVGIIIGTAFGKIVTSLVSDLIMPIIGVIIGGFNFQELSITIGKSQIHYGSFIQSVVDFVIVALCIFVIVKMINRFNKKTEEKMEKEEKKIESDELIVLKEIRNLLQDKQKK